MGPGAFPRSDGRIQPISDVGDQAIQCGIRFDSRPARSVESLPFAEAQRRKHRVDEHSEIGTALRRTPRFLSHEMTLRPDRMAAPQHQAETRVVEGALERELPVGARGDVLVPEGPETCLAERTAQPPSAKVSAAASRTIRSSSTRRTVR